MIGSYLTHKVVDGVFRLVQVVTYSSGKKVQRVLDANGVPVAILDEQA